MLRFTIMLILLCTASCGSDSGELQGGRPVDLRVNGEPWTFATPAPEKVTLRDHPRLLITAENIDSVRAKWNDAAWASERSTTLKGMPAVGNAMRYLLDGDTAAGEAAKAALLGLPETQKRIDYGGYWWCLVYDWTHDLYTPAEREVALHRVLRCYGLNMPDPGKADLTAFAPVKGHVTGGFSFGNDAHEPRTHTPGYQLRGVVGLAFGGDGVRDEFCQYILDAMVRRADDRMIYPIYDPVRGGLLDGHNVVALDSGGCQAGQHTTGVVTGYSSMYTETITLLMSAWSTATGDDLYPRDNFTRLLPHWVAYEQGPWEFRGTSRVGQVMQHLAGIYRFTDPDMASLAAWMGGGKYLEPVTLILGDKGVVPKSPADLGLPLSAFLRGADRCYSRSSWDDDALRIELTTRTMDLQRYEPDPGLVEIGVMGERLIMSGQTKKGNLRCYLGSGLLLYNPKGELVQPFAAYWSGQRINDSPLKAATDPLYQGPLPTVEIDDAVATFSISDDILYERNRADVHHVRTLTHDKVRNTVTVTDEVEIPGDWSYVIQWRTGGKTTIAADTFSVEAGDASLTASVRGACRLEPYNNGDDGYQGENTGVHLVPTAGGRQTFVTTFTFDDLVPASKPKR